MLIETDTLINDLRKLIRTPRSTIEIEAKLIPLIEKQPKAYDLERVKEQLKEEIETMREKGDECEEEGLIDLYDTFYGKRLAYEKSLEIVSEGALKK
jgi:hypothetical protein